MKWLIYFSLFATTVFSQNIYQQHLPQIVYEYADQQGLLSEDISENSIRKESGEIVDIVTFKIENNQGEYIVIYYCCYQPVENFSGIQVAYQNGRAIAYVIFDEKGYDYVAYPPFSEEDQENITSTILDLMTLGIHKLIENQQ